MRICCGTPSSPYFPQSNGMAERTVQTVKNLLKQSSKDPYLALLSYRATPLTWCQVSPAELMMGRRLRTSVPQTTKQLTPNWPHLAGFRDADKAYKEKQKQDYDSRYRVKELPELPDDRDVWITTENEPVRGSTSTAEFPRSYNVETPSGEIRRNRSQLNTVPDSGEPVESPRPSPQPPESPKQIMTRSRTGTQIHPPERLA